MKHTERVSISTETEFPSRKCPLEPEGGMAGAEVCAGAFRRHETGAGFTLLWREGEPVPLAAADHAGAAVVFLYQLPGLSEEGSMAVFRTAGPGAPKFPVQVALLLDETAAGQLLSEAASAHVGAILSDEGHYLLPMSQAARMAVESIRRCPFSGAFRGLALTARAHDLLLAFISASAALAPSSPMRNVVDRLRLAAEVLDREYERPPALSELAQRVGLSESSLKRGFPHLWGTTVFGYLRERRLEHARQLLQSGEATVLEAAERVGYSNPSNFAAAFRARFGVNPKAYQLGVRRPAG